MEASLDKIKSGMSQYLESELATKTTGLPKFLTYFCIPVITSKADDLYHSLQDNILAKDFFSEDGDVDIDRVYNLAKDAIHRSGSIEMLGIRFNEADVDSLYHYIVRA